MALRHRVCHSLAHARLISRLMSPREEKDVKLLSVSIFTTNRGHSVLGKKIRQSRRKIVTRIGRVGVVGGNQDAA